MTQWDFTSRFAPLTLRTTKTADLGA